MRQLYALTSREVETICSVLVVHCDDGEGKTRLAPHHRPSGAGTGVSGQARAFATDIEIVTRSE